LKAVSGKEEFATHLIPAIKDPTDLDPPTARIR